jgi:glutathione synthase/RimK-type ligase-like ATP-grasp enzyme
VKPLALACCAQFPRSCPDDAPLLAALEAARMPFETVPWDAKEDWSRFAGVLVRAAWDYQERPEAFLGWADAVARASVPLWNPVPILRWNIDKRYLLDLASRGVRTVPTRVLPRGGPALLDDVLAAQGWREAVVKPGIGAGGFGAFRVGPGEGAMRQPMLDALLARRDALVQPFLPEVLRDGEWSFVFLEGAFSHAARKQAAPGEFRVHVEHGGSSMPAAPSPDAVAQARAAVDAVDEPLLYARVDGVFVDGQFTLMEFEVIEPELFFGFDPSAAPRLVRALRTRLA